MEYAILDVIIPYYSLTNPIIMNELTLYDYNFILNLSEKFELHSTIFGCLKTNIMDIKTGHRNRCHIGTEAKMDIYRF